MTEDDDGGLGARIRPYAMTGGRTRGTTDLPMEALVRATPQGVSAEPRLAMERKKIVTLCATPISVAEISAHLHVPIGVVRVLVGDMSDEGLLDTLRPR
ncbi:hypothetical protein B7486_69960, partial [cyanobacterium TDX16]